MCRVIIRKKAPVTEIMSLGHRNVFPTPALVQGAILTAMRDLCEYATDTVWLTPYETVFERLATLYLLAGGLEQNLIDEWPEYFSTEVNK